MIKLAVYAICKNEIDKIENWLEKVQEADYICILDTGSTDGTYEFLEKQSNITLKQYIFDYFRFDDARNMSLELVPEDADICLPLDIDQIPDPYFSQKIKNKWSEDIDKLYLPQYFKFSNSSGRWFAHTKKNAFWKYPVYEQITFNKRGAKFIEIFDTMIIHYDDNEKESHKQYLALAELGVKERPSDPYCKHTLHRLQNNKYKKGDINNGNN